MNSSEVDGCRRYSAAQKLRLHSQGIKSVELLSCVLFSFELPLMKGRVDDRKPASIPACLFYDCPSLSVVMHCGDKGLSASLGPPGVFTCLQEGWQSGACVGRWVSLCGAEVKTAVVQEQLGETSATNCSRIHFHRGTACR